MSPCVSAPARLASRGAARMGCGAHGRPRLTSGPCEAFIDDGQPSRKTPGTAPGQPFTVPGCGHGRHGREAPVTGHTSGAPAGENAGDDRGGRR
jgi:hypothetical protein